MKIFSKLLVVVLLLANSIVPVEAQNGSRPNILLIVSDDQKWSDYGFMGHPQIQTPHLDRLALQSRTFRRGYVPTSLCCPSLASILTGRSPQALNITGNEPPLPGASGERYRNPEFLRQLEEMMSGVNRHPNLAATLGKAGYLSLQTGKWWFGDPKQSGFTHAMSHGDVKRGGRHGDEGLKVGRESLKPVTDFMDNAQATGKPFFVWYAPMLPHQPHTPPERLLAKYRTKTPSLYLAKYWAMCEWFDETCGTLLDYLDAKGIAKNTIVVYVTDNGWIQNPNRDQYAPRSKQSPYDGGLRTPIMVRWLDKVKPGYDDTPVSSLDIAPTLFQAAGVKPLKGLEGVNLLDSRSIRRRKSVFGATFLHSAKVHGVPAKNLTSRWCVSEGWKLILPTQLPSPIEGFPTQPELYRISEDPEETANLAAQRPEQVQKLRSLMDKWWKIED